MSNAFRQQLMDCSASSAGGVSGAVGTVLARLTAPTVPANSGAILTPERSDIDRCTQVQPHRACKRGALSDTELRIEGPRCARLAYMPTRHLHASMQSRCGT